jgi:hypothetical protein
MLLLADNALDDRLHLDKKSCLGEVNKAIMGGQQVESARAVQCRDISLGGGN